jgi:hypothetical protein
MNSSYLLEHGFDGAAHPFAQPGLKVLTELKNGVWGCATVLRGVILRTALAGGDCWFGTQQEVMPFSISTKSGTDPRNHRSRSSVQQL